MQRKTPKKRVHKKRKNIFKIIIPVVLLSIFVFWVFNSTFFNIETINVNNNKVLKKNDILKQAKISRNTNIFKFSSKDIKNNLNKNPFVESVVVKRKIPNGIDINIKERERSFNLQYLSKYLIIDKEGFVLEHVKKQNKDLPTIKGFSWKTTKVGENIFSKEENKTLQIFINEAETLKLFSEMEEIDKDFANDVNIKLKNNIDVEFGTLDDSKYKLRILDGILGDVEGKDIKAKKIILNKGDQFILNY